VNRTHYPIPWLIKSSKLKARLEQEFSEFPEAVKYQPGDSTRLPFSDRVLNIRMYIRTKYLQNHFLLERLAIKHGQADGQALVDIARESLSLTLVLYTNRDQCPNRHHNYEWMVSTFFHSPCCRAVDVGRKRSESTICKIKESPTEMMIDRVLRRTSQRSPLLRTPQAIQKSPPSPPRTPTLRNDPKPQPIHRFPRLGTAYIRELRDLSSHAGHYQSRTRPSLGRACKDGAGRLGLGRG
jgi:hypothetical protein